MADLSRYRGDTYEGFASSTEILAAIAEVSGEDYDPPEAGASYDKEGHWEDSSIGYDDRSAFVRLWASPTEEECRIVEALAWTLAEPDTEALHWGQETIRRPAR